MVRKGMVSKFALPIDKKSLTWIQSSKDKQKDQEITRLDAPETLTDQEITRSDAQETLRDQEIALKQAFLTTGCTNPRHTIFALVDSISHHTKTFISVIFSVCFFIV